MKKNQKGISKIMIFLIVVVIIVSIALVFAIKAKISGGSESSNPGNNDPFLSVVAFSNFSTDVDTVNVACTIAGEDLLSNALANNFVINSAQAYNCLAKGSIVESGEGVALDVVTREQASAISCTRIEKETALEMLGIELPEVSVDTPNAKAVKVSYFITNEGNIFIWPPFAYNEKFYVNVNTEVTTPDGVVINKANEFKMYENDFEFVVGNVDIKVSDKTESGIGLVTDDISVDVLSNLASIYYKDIANATSPKGIESK